MLSVTRRALVAVTASPRAGKMKTLLHCDARPAVDVAESLAGLSINHRQHLLDVNFVGVSKLPKINVALEIVRLAKTAL